jgi:hypothetical protein
MFSMRTTVDIPDPVYRRLKARAASQGCSVKELVLRGVKAELENSGKLREKRRITLPLVDSKKPGRLELTNSQINEILFP